MDADPQDGTNEGYEATDRESDGQLESRHVDFTLNHPTLGHALELMATLMMELEPRRVVLAFYVDRQEAP